MKKTLTLFALTIGLTISACVPQVVDTPAPLVLEPTQVAAIESPASADPSGLKTYTNDAFGLSFQFPASWFGPEEYVSDPDLRVEIGTGKVYPYGTDPAERTDELTNSYNVVIQYSKNNQNGYWGDIYQSLLNMKDGESLSDTRGLMIRVRQLNLGRFSGIEYISTLSETAQTSALYIRQVVLFDDQSNLLTLMGQPINVEIGDGTAWREVYQRIDEENLAVFHQIVESIMVQ